MKRSQYARLIAHSLRASRQRNVTVDPRKTTTILQAIVQGDDTAVGELTPLVYEELRRIAGRRFNDAGGPLTLQPTAIVHEAFIKLVDRDTVNYNGQSHFMAVAATAIRHVLIDHARRKGAQKRGGDRGRITLTDARAESGGEEVDLLELDDTLNQLAELDPRAARVVELRFFGGLTDAAVAGLLNVSERTVRNDWAMARAWLRQSMSERSRSQDHGDVADADSIQDNR